MIWDKIKRGVLNLLNIIHPTEYEDENMTWTPRNTGGSTTTVAKRSPRSTEFSQKVRPSSVARLGIKRGEHEIAMESPEGEWQTWSRFKIVQLNEIFRDTGAEAAETIETPLSVCQQMCELAFADSIPENLLVIANPEIVVCAIVNGCKNITLAIPQHRHHRVPEMINSLMHDCLSQDTFPGLFGDVKVNVISTGELGNMKFDAIISNPPYNKGLLDRSTLLDLPRKAKEAASIRIDSAFVVSAYEKWLKDGGTSVFLWPYKWTQLSSFLPFRNWLKGNGKKMLVAPMINFDAAEEAKVNAAITVHTKTQSDTFLILHNEMRHSEPLVIDMNGRDIIPIPYGNIGLGIHDKAMRFPMKLKYRRFGSGNLPMYCHMHGTAGGTDGSTTSLNSHLLSTSLRQKLMASIIKDEAFHHSNMTSNIPVIAFENVEHKSRYPGYHGSKLYNFILHQIKVDFNNTSYNLGKIPDLIRDMEGEYTDEKAYAILGLTQEEIEHVEKTVGPMPTVVTPK